MASAEREPGSRSSWILILRGQYLTDLSHAFCLVLASLSTLVNEVTLRRAIEPGTTETLYR